MRAWLNIILLFPVVFVALGQPASQGAFPITQVDAQYQFGEWIEFGGRVDNPAAVAEINLFVQPDGRDITLGLVSPHSDGKIQHRLDARRLAIAPFTRLQYWFRVVMRSGETQESERFTLLYADNRFTWQNLSSDRFEVRWYQRDLKFGQSVLNTAQAGLKAASAYLPVSSGEVIKIYVYQQAGDLQKALQLNQTSWIAGHANPAQNIILISISGGPEQQLEMERQIPHEIMHILQYRLVGEGQQHLPGWLTEGTASLAELYPNPDYERTLQRAAGQNDLLALSTLCYSFPQGSEDTFLAYAQSASFMRFLHQKYGASGLERLMKEYGNGLGCEEGAAAALGEPLSRLESLWRQEALGLNRQGLVFQNLTPYLVLLAVVLLAPFASLLTFRGKSKEL